MNPKHEAALRLGVKLTFQDVAMSWADNDAFVFLAGLVGRSDTTA
jgi:hypothetical protein